MSGVFQAAMYHRKAVDFLQRHGFADDGAVFFWQSEPYACRYCLGTPTTERPGVIAYFRGKFFTTVGGDDYNGAAEWLPVSCEGVQS